MKHDEEVKELKVGEFHGRGWVCGRVKPGGMVVARGVSWRVGARCTLPRGHLGSHKGKFDDVWGNDEK